jgi:hypothetical protein
VLTHRAMKTKGKNYGPTREPIALYLMVNECEVETIEEYLTANKYCNYNGITTLPNVDSAY